MVRWPFGHFSAAGFVPNQTEVLTKGSEQSRWGDARAVAQHLGVQVPWVTENAAILGGVPSGDDGIRFDLHEIASRIRPPEPGFDDSPQAMAKLDLQGRFREINPRFSRLVGYTEIQFRRARWPSPHDREHFIAQQRQLSALVSGREQTLTFESRFLHGRGVLFEMRGLIACVTLAGAPSYLLLVAEQPHA